MTDAITRAAERIIELQCERDQYGGLSISPNEYAAIIREELAKDDWTQIPAAMMDNLCEHIDAADFCYLCDCHPPNHAELCPLLKDVP